MTDIKIGDRVTAEHPSWHDGQAVTGWPNQDYVAVVLGLEVISGLVYATCKRDRMAKPYRETIDRLYKVERKDHEQTERP